MHPVGKVGGAYFRSNVDKGSDIHSVEEGGGAYYHSLSEPSVCLSYAVLRVVSVRGEPERRRVKVPQSSGTARRRNELWCRRRFGSGVSG